MKSSNSNIFNSLVLVRTSLHIEPPPIDIKHLPWYLHYMTDNFPRRTFYVDQNDSQLNAIKLIKALGDQLAAEKPEIADYYRDRTKLLSQLDIARICLPEEAAKYPGVTKKAVGYALRKLIPPKECRELARIRYQKAANNNFDRSPEIQSHRATIRHQIHGVDVHAMLEGRGRIAWSTEEKELTKALALDSNYLTPKNAPDTHKIATELNQRFHSGKNIRFANSVGSFLRDLRRKNPQKY